MKSATLVTTLSRLASRAEPPPIDDADVRRMISRAVRAEPLPRRSRAWLVAAVAITATLAIWVLRPSTPVDHREGHVLEMTLPTGDHLVGVAGARFDIAELAPAKRRIELHGGTVLFDVAHVVAGQRFAVVTDHLVATAKGTVFSVETDAVRSRVRVYEGVVEVEQAGQTHALLAGALWDSATESTDFAIARPAALAPSIEVALRERARAIVASSQTTPPQTAALQSPVQSTAIQPTENPASSQTTTSRASSSAIASPSGSHTATVSPPTTSSEVTTVSPTAASPSKATTVSPTSASPTSPSGASSSNTVTIAATTNLPTAAWSTDSVPLAKLSPAQLLATARADLVTGKFGDALDAAKLAEPWNGAWWQIVADAHRGAGEIPAAAAAYDRAAKQLTGADRNEAGYSAAYLRFKELHQNAAALASIDAAGADAAGTPLEERALGLRAQILVALGRRGDATAIARRYLAQFPHADLRAYMLDLTK